jgi:hypothetical protein
MLTEPSSNGPTIRSALGVLNFSSRPGRRGNRAGAFDIRSSAYV